MKRIDFKPRKSKRLLGRKGSFWAGLLLLGCVIVLGWSIKFPTLILLLNASTHLQNLHVPHIPECGYEKAIEYYFCGFAVVFVLGIVGIEMSFGRWGIIGRWLENFGWLYLLGGDLFLGFLLFRYSFLRN